eukprot:gb/GFBE01047480.1/.p1 GENE.gb/GFBE01047480.1/~~gb/GFBE01047480.1/.p1  ORF type:complete len:1048 (+),score=274.91 gb/GFBE01047480.1/:1-3144(+)
MMEGDTRPAEPSCERGLQAYKWAEKRLGTRTALATAISAGITSPEAATNSGLFSNDVDRMVLVGQKSFMISGSRAGNLTTPATGMSSRQLSGATEILQPLPEREPLSLYGAQARQLPPGAIDDGYATETPALATIPQKEPLQISLSPQPSPRVEHKQSEGEVRHDYQTIKAELKGQKAPMSNNATGKDGEALQLREKLKRIVEAPGFDAAFALLIVVNTAIMAFQVQYSGFDVGYELRYFGMEKPASEVWPAASEVFLAFDWFFGILFTLEVFLKLLAIDVKFFKDPWNLLDAVVILAWMVDKATEGVLPLDPMLLRILRLIKLGRLLRLIRTIQGFDSLYIMITSIYGSLAALSWSVLLLAVVLMIFALFISTMVEPYVMDKNQPDERRFEVYKYYGTFSRASLTMFELVLANWVPASRALTENVGEGWMLFVLFFKITIGFSVVKVLMGVFLQVTFHVAANDDLIMVNQAERAIKNHTKKMGLLFKCADQDGNGRLDEDEFSEIMTDKTVVQWLSAMGFEAAHFSGRDVYRLLVEPGGDMSAEELIRGVSKLKGPATALNMALIKRDYRATRGSIKRLASSLDTLREDKRLGGEGFVEAAKSILDRDDKSEDGEESQARKSLRFSETMFEKKIQDMEIGEGDGRCMQARRKMLEVVNSAYFEMFFASAIALCTIVMAAQVQYQGIENGYQLKYEGMTLPAAEAWPGAKEAFDVIEVVFGITFTVEIVFKLFAMGHIYFKEVWNVFDVAIVGAWYIEAYSMAALPLEPMILRLFRLIRLLRMVRLVKIFEQYDALYLMVTSIKGSIAALSWSTLLLIVIQTMLSMMMATLLESWFLNDDTSVDKHEVYRYFGTFSKSFLTFFEITLGNWIPVCRTMVRNWSELYVLPALVHKFIMGFAVVMVISGVFIQETMKVAQTDNTIMLNQRERASKLHTKKMKVLFAVADSDGSGRLDAEEFEQVCADPQVQVWLSAMGIDVSDAKAVHQTICETTGGDDISAEELITGMAYLKGAARNMDMCLLRRENVELREMVEKLQQQVDHMTGTLG